MNAGASQSKATVVVVLATSNRFVAAVGGSGLCVEMCVYVLCLFVALCCVVCAQLTINRQQRVCPEYARGCVDNIAV